MECWCMGTGLLLLDCSSHWVHRWMPPPVRHIIIPSTSSEGVLLSSSHRHKCLTAFSLVSHARVTWQLNRWVTWQLNRWSHVSRHFCHIGHLLSCRSSASFGSWYSIIYDWASRWTVYVFKELRLVHCGMHPSQPIGKSAHPKNYPLMISPRSLL